MRYCGFMPGLQRTPPYAQVVTYYVDQIRAGKLRPGDEVPSTRQLAHEWQIATSTAQRALEQLRADGWIETRPGKPAVVASRS